MWNETSIHLKNRLHFLKIHFSSYLSFLLPYYLSWDKWVIGKREDKFSYQSLKVNETFLTGNIKLPTKTSQNQHNRSLCQYFNIFMWDFCINSNEGWCFSTVISLFWVFRVSWSSQSSKCVHCELQSACRPGWGSISYSWSSNHAKSHPRSSLH